MAVKSRHCASSANHVLPNIAKISHHVLRVVVRVLGDIVVDVVYDTNNVYIHVRDAQHLRCAGTVHTVSNHCVHARLKTVTGEQIILIVVFVGGKYNKQYYLLV